jgi:3-deoxy-7-phosphoheptulonate synthase
MVDTSHANSQKDHENQPKVAAALAEQIADGNRGLMGVMIESHLRPGRQAASPGKPLEYGVSITDACLGFEATIPVLENLAQAISQRRRVSPTFTLD